MDSRLATGVLGFPPGLAAPDGPLALPQEELALEPSITGSKPGLPAPAESNAILKSKRPP